MLMRSASVQVFSAGAEVLRGMLDRIPAAGGPRSGNVHKMVLFRKNPSCFSGMKEVKSPFDLLINQ
jgi:hypothetical protein